MNSDGFAPGFIFGCVACLAFAWWLKFQVDDSWRHQIEQHGCAEFYLDSDKDHQWHWLDEKKALSHEH